MKRVDLVRHLERNGCQQIREGANHTVYYNPSTQRTSTVPRHREVKNPTAIRICKQLVVPDHFAETVPAYIIKNLGQSIHVNPRTSAAKKF